MVTTEYIYIGASPSASEWAFNFNKIQCEGVPMGTKKFIGVHQLTYDQAVKEIQTGDILFGSGEYLR